MPFPEGVTPPGAEEFSRHNGETFEMKPAPAEVITAVTKKMSIKAGVLHIPKTVAYREHQFAIEMVVEVGGRQLHQVPAYNGVILDVSDLDQQTLSIRMTCTDFNRDEPFIFAPTQFEYKVGQDHASVS